MPKNPFLMMFVIVAFMVLAVDANAQILFSNNFEDSNLEPEVGSWNFAETASTSVVPTSEIDPTLGAQVGLIDRAEPQMVLDLTLNLVNTASLANGGSVEINFDFAARRINGNSRTIFVDAVDSTGAIVTRFVLGDSNAFGMGGGDRQRPGYDIDDTGIASSENSRLPEPGTPGSFWWGSDGTPDSFDVVRDAHFSITISASSFGVDTTGAFKGEYSTTGIANYNGGTFADIAELRLSSAVETGNRGFFGFYIDNIVVEAFPGTGSGDILPTEFDTFRGTVISATLSDFLASDDVAASYLPGFTIGSFEAPVWLIFDGNGAEAAGIQVESSAGTPGLEYTVEAFNWAAGAYDIVGVQAELFNADQTVPFAITPDDHIDTNGDIRTRVGWRRVGFTINFPWQVNVDQVIWTQ